MEEHEYRDGPKVLVLGLPRTGTTSIRVALGQLGYKRHYYWDSLNHNQGRDDPKWTALLNRKFHGSGKITREDFNPILATYQSLADWPCSIFAQELAEAYPDAQVILSVRDSPEAWCKSFGDTVWKYQRLKFFPSTYSERFWEWLTPHHPRKDLMRLIVTNTPFPDFATRGPQWYLDHNERVRSSVPSARLLEYNAKQGWEPLCRFLEKPLPERKFPNTNGSEGFQRAIDEQWAGFQVKKYREWLRGFSLLMVGTTILLFLFSQLPQDLHHAPL